MEKFGLVMIETTRGKDDDPTCSVETYEAGETYQVGRGLYVSFVDHMKVARPVASGGADNRETKVAGPTEKKPAGGKRQQKTEG